MSKLGELLELLHTARRRHRSLQATIRNHYHQISATELRGYAGQDTIPVEPGRSETRSRVCWEPPGRVREEELDGPAPRALAIRDGERWWRREADGTVSSNEHEPDLDMSIAAPAQLLFNPAPLIPLLFLQPLGESSVAGRTVLLARGLPRPTPHRRRPLLHGLGADEIQLAVDRERGVLLRHEASSAGHSYSQLEVEEIEFDLDFPTATFALPTTAPPPPPGPQAEELSLEAAAARARFAVWAPPQLQEWHLNAYYYPGDTHSHLPESVHIRIWRPDGRWIWIEQTSTADPDLNALRGSWEPVSHNGKQFEVLSPANNVGSQVSARMILDTTRTTFLTRSVGLDTVLDLAASLQRLDPQ